MIEVGEELDFAQCALRVLQVPKRVWNFLDCDLFVRQVIFGGTGFKQLVAKNRARGRRGTNANSARGIGHGRRIQNRQKKIIQFY